MACILGWEGHQALGVAMAGDAAPILAGLAEKAAHKRPAASGKSRLLTRSRALLRVCAYRPLRRVRLTTAVSMGPVRARLWPRRRP